ncbi:MAG: hypothetical protein EOO77_17385 [Oxalobacteraceae bacterium]|nr:MAG: hypothetical protein EOO77_17385 [Oxalobacteraceae bacterium]
MAGLYRNVRDEELRDIFYLTPQKGSAFMLEIQTGAFHGSNRPGVTALLRDMLGLMKMTFPQRTALRQKIARTLAAREDIAVKAKLVSLTTMIPQRPWAFPALLDTPTCRGLYTEMNKIAGYADTPASGLADPVSEFGIAAAISKIFRAFGTVVTFGVDLTRYLGGKTKDYYAFYAKRISDELALRGIAPSSLQ